VVVLDPNHPLMVRYQQFLKNHLLKREEKLNIQLREVDNEIKVNHYFFFFFSIRNRLVFFHLENT
jgi:hypothetical protein